MPIADRLQISRTIDIDLLVSVGLYLEMTGLSGHRTAATDNTLTVGNVGIHGDSRDNVKGV